MKRKAKIKNGKIVNLERMREMKKYGKRKAKNNV